MLTCKGIAPDWSAKLRKIVQSAAIKDPTRLSVAQSSKLSLDGAQLPPGSLLPRCLWIVVCGNTSMPNKPSEVHPSIVWLQ